MADALARPDLLALVVHIVGTGLFAGVFLFLQRESQIVYFGYWSLAWALRAAALLFNLASGFTGQGLLLLPYALLEMAFAASLLFAAASVSGRFDIRVSYAAPLLLVIGLAAYAGGLFSNFKGFFAIHSTLLTAAYGANFFSFRRRWQSGRTAGKLFSVALLSSSLFYSHYALLYSSLYVVESAPTPAYLRFHDLYDLMLETLLAFSAMILWMEAQNQQLEQANKALAQSRLEISLNARMDPLTGLMNRVALDEMCAGAETVSGVLAVLDLDNFKDVNDALGHLTGDEVLASVGNLIKSSIRKDDLAWRWGGDEFVLLFKDQSREAVEERMRVLEERLLRFRLRGKGVLPVTLSWGTAQVDHASLREALSEADHHMYLKKRDRVSPSKFFGPSHR